MSRPVRLPAALCALAVSCGLSLAVANAGAAPVAGAARACRDAPAPGSLNGGYFLGLNVKGATCPTATRVELGVQSCRVKVNPKAGCHAKVLGFTCHEKRQTIPTQITARVACKNGKKTVSYTYQQDLN